MRVPSSALEISGHDTTERWNRFERHWLLLLVAMVGGVDLESWADLVGLVPFLALGVGLFAATRPKRERVVVGLGLCTLADPASAVLPTNDVSAMNDASENRAVAPEMETIYWQWVKPETCHYRLSAREEQWLERTGAEYDDRRCGRWPATLS